jgi:hypothetical protein
MVKGRREKMVGRKEGVWWRTWQSMKELFFEEEVLPSCWNIQCQRNLGHQIQKCELIIQEGTGKNKIRWTEFRRNLMTSSTGEWGSIPDSDTQRSLCTDHLDGSGCSVVCVLTIQMVLGVQWFVFWPVLCHQKFKLLLLYKNWNTSLLKIYCSKSRDVWKHDECICGSWWNGGSYMAVGEGGKYRKFLIGNWMKICLSDFASSNAGSWSGRW